MKSSSCWTPRLASASLTSTGQDVALQDGAFQPGADLFRGQGAGGEILFHQFFVVLGDLFQQRFAAHADLVLERVGDGDLLALALVVAAELPGLHLDDVHQAAEIRALADRELHGDHVLAEGGDQGVEGLVEVDQFLAHLVDDERSRLAHLAHAVEDLLGLHLDAVLGARRPSRRSPPPSAPPWSPRRNWRIPGVSRILILTLSLIGVGQRSLDGDLAGDLLLVEIGDRVALVHLAQAVDHLGVVQQAPRPGWFFRCGRGRPRPRCAGSRSVFPSCFSSWFCLDKQ